MALKAKRNFVSTFSLLWQGKNRFACAAACLLLIALDYFQLSLWCKFFVREKQLKNEKTFRIHTRTGNRLYRLFQNNRGTWVKAGQFLSARPDLLPVPVIEALVPLQSQVKPLPFSAMESVLVAAYGECWSARFDFFDESPVASASIAQVYRARLNGGGLVAVKVQRPDIAALFSQDIVLYRMLAKIINVFSKAVDFRAAMDVFLESMHNELDFVGEAENIRQFSKLPHIYGVRTPALVEGFCTPDIVVTQWIDGEGLLSYLDRHDRTSQMQLLLLIQNSFVQQVVRFGLFQCDPHPGNFLVDSNGHLVILDLGHLGRLSKRERLSYVKLISAVLARDASLLSEALRDGGLTAGLDRSFAENLLELLVAVSIKSASELNFSVIEMLLRRILGSLNARQLEVPRHYLFTGKVLITIGGILKLYHTRPHQIDIRDILFA